MNNELINKSEIKLVGLSVRTNNKNEMNPKTAKIGEVINQFYANNISSKIINRKNPGVTLSVYAEYESDEHGDYTYFFGEEVSSFENVPADFKQLIIPAARYQKFTTPTGKSPAVVIEAWQKIWALSPHYIGSKRAYLADFEVYDQRAIDH